MSSQSNNPDKKNEGNIGAGIAMGILIYILTVPVVLSFTSLWLLIIAPLIHIGAIIYFFAKGRRYTGIGLLLIAGFALLLVAACYGWVFTMNL
ncbi:hypothetical protein [Neobacillus terrae]|uniref:hypothetical protein n=1 Tax=Neobacillus terrae TaxID=3034837 RepID=UPI00140CD33C|nr:hypothetical protein [Neobacillus terrae]NHM31196.1 hypothetical protein [Neobacillus terrae]